MQFIGNTPVINESGGPTRNTRIDVSVHIAYGSDVGVVKNLMTGIAMDSEYVLKNPFPITRFVEFGESGMEFKLLCWIKEASDRGPAIDELNTAIYESLQKSNIEIPYQKQDIYIKEFKQNKKMG
ncbi:MAG: mechanosensitive ion channel family protein [Candidatus Moraniibacteriota bacterium]|jgi:MscS family membrane protein